IGRRMGLPECDLDSLYRGGLIHDIGKIGVPDAILLKPGPLDSEETMAMHLHPIIGENIVAPLRSGAGLLPIIRHHHENFDGLGRLQSHLPFMIPLLSALELIGFVGSAYALLLYRDSLIPLPRRWHVAAIGSLAAASGFLVSAVAFAASRTVLIVTLVLFIAVWSACVGEPIIRFWIAARTLPAVQAWRLR